MSGRALLAWSHTPMLADLPEGQHQEGGVRGT